MVERKVFDNFVGELFSCKLWNGRDKSAFNVHRKRCVLV